MLEDMRKKLLTEITGSGTDTLKNTPTSFSMQVEKFARIGKLTLMDALMVLVEEHQLDPDQVPKLIMPSLKEKLGIETGILKQAKPIDFN